MSRMINDVKTVNGMHETYTYERLRALCCASARSLAAKLADPREGYLSGEFSNPRPLGLLRALLSFGEGERITVDAIRRQFAVAGRCCYGKTQIKSDIEALESRGLLIRGQIRAGGGKVSSEMVYLVVDERARYDEYFAILEEVAAIKTKRPDAAVVSPAGDGAKSTQADAVLAAAAAAPDAADETASGASDPRADMVCDGGGGEPATRGAESRPTAVENPKTPCSEPKSDETDHGGGKFGHGASAPSRAPLVINRTSSNRPSYKSGEIVTRTPDLKEIHPTCNVDIPLREGHAAPLSQRSDIHSVAGRAGALSGCANARAADPVGSTLSELIRLSVNKNRTTRLVDREQMRRRIEQIRAEGYELARIVEAWRRRQGRCMAEGREARYYPQLLKWLENEALEQLGGALGDKVARTRKRGDLERRVERAIRFTALKDDDPAFAALVRARDVTGQDVRYGMASQAELDEAQSAVDEYFAEHAGLALSDGARVA